VGEGEITSGDYTVYYSAGAGGRGAERSVTIVVHTNLVKSAVKKIVCSDRIIAVKLKAEPARTLIVQVYMSTSEYEDEEVEQLYDMTEELREEDGKGETKHHYNGRLK
jgi:hypothetical protein